MGFRTEPCNTAESFVQVSDGGVREAILTALKGVLQHAGKSVSVAVRTRVYVLLKDFVHHDDDQVRNSAASILGILSQVCCHCFKEFFLRSLLHSDVEKVLNYFRMAKCKLWRFLFMQYIFCVTAWPIV